MAEFIDIWPSEKAQADAERQRVAQRQLVQAQRAARKASLEPLCGEDVEPSVCPHAGKSTLLVLIAIGLTLLALCGLDILTSIGIFH